MANLSLNLSETAAMSQGHDGEIQGRGNTVMTGSWPLPEATAPSFADGWCSCGDIGGVDRDGFYCIVDGKTELAIGDLLGEMGGTAVERKRGATATALESGGLVKERIAADKYHRQVWCVDELPKGATVRILRRKVRAARTEMASS